MTDCCNPNAGFPNATSMEQMATNNAVVWEEISDIQQGIIAASSQCQIGGGQFCTTIGGRTPMTFMSGISYVTVTNPGAGYVVDSPALKFIAPNGSSGTGATGTLTTNGGNILSIAVTAGGTGYQPVPATLALSTVSGINAVLVPLVDAAGRIAAVNIVNTGSGYTVNDSVIATRAVAPNSAYVNAAFKITAVSITGEILAVVVTNPGSGYQDSVTTVEIVSTVTPTTAYPLGTGLQANVLTDSGGAIIGVTIINSGYGYAVMNPYLVITDPGHGATTQVGITSGSVSSVTVLTAGTGYTQAATGVILNPLTAPSPTTQATTTFKVYENTLGTDPQLYWQVWAGAATNKPISAQLNTVLSYFKNLGYTISIQSNPATGNTIQWKICW